MDDIIIHLSLPVYQVYNVGRGSKKKEKKSLISWNWFMNMNPFKRRDFRRDYAEIITEKLKNIKRPIEGKYSVTYIYHYKNEKSDLPNVVSIVSKTLNDVLSELSIVVDDNVKYLIEESSIVGIHDPEDPRIDITIREENG